MTADPPSNALESNVGASRKRSIQPLALKDLQKGSCSEGGIRRMVRQKFTIEAQFKVDRSTGCLRAP